MNDNEFWQLVGIKSVTVKDCTASPTVHGKSHPNDVCHYEYKGEGTYSSLPDMDLVNLYKYAVPTVLDKIGLVEVYSFAQISGRYYSEASVWRAGKRNGDNVLKGEIVCKSFAQNFDLEATTTKALRGAIEIALMEVGEEVTK